MTIEKNFFRQVMGRFATGVTVVTTRSEKGLSGLTVNSFCSVSLDPPLVLVCVDLTSNTLSFIRESGTFVVNILTDQQEHLSRCFATPSQERYEHFCHAGYCLAATGSPVLDGALAFIDVRVVAEYPGGDHAIFVGQVEAMGAGGQVAFADGAGMGAYVEAERSGAGMGAYVERSRHSVAEQGDIASGVGDTEQANLDGHNGHIVRDDRATPLAYYRGQYRHLAHDYQRPSLAAYYDEDAK